MKPYWITRDTSNTWSSFSFKMKLFSYNSVTEVHKFVNDLPVCGLLVELFPVIHTLILEGGKVIFMQKWTPLKEYTVL